MSKVMLSVRVEALLRDALYEEARLENRSAANMLEVLLDERYGRAARDVPDPVVLVRPDVSAAPGHVPSALAATVPGVRVASAVCNVSPPGRSRPSCTLPAKHDGRHSWEAGS